MSIVHFLFISLNHLASSSELGIVVALADVKNTEFQAICQNEQTDRTVVSNSAVYRWRITKYVITFKRFVRRISIFTFLVLSWNIKV